MSRPFEPVFCVKNNYRYRQYLPNPAATPYLLSQAPGVFLSITKTGIYLVPVNYRAYSINN